MNRAVRVGMFGAMLWVAACNKGKSKSEIFDILDKHRLSYGKCELMAQSKDQIDGKPAWMAATVCRVKHRQEVLTEVGESSKFEDWFEDWKKEKGPKAVQDARSAPASKSAKGDDCPHGAACMNRCRSECESKHGRMIDTASLGPCSRAGGKPDECIAKATNKAAQACFLRCRGL